MKKQILCVTLLLLISFTLPLTATAQVVNIPDPNLRAAIENTLRKASGDTITVADMQALEVLDANDTNISDLTSLEFATNLERLYLSDNLISDISALAGLTLSSTSTYGHVRLDLSNNSISDISGLAGVTLSSTATSGHAGSVTLDLSNNSISDISGLAGVTLSSTATSGHAGFVTLDLSNNSISDISALAGLTELHGLYLSNNNILDISALAGLTELRGLYLSNNNISDISALAGLTELRGLYLSNNNISDISALAGLTELHGLYLSNNNISDLFPLVANMGLGFRVEALGLENLDDWNEAIRLDWRKDAIEVWGNPLSDTSINTHIPTLRGRGIRGLHRSQIFLPATAPVAVGGTFTLNIFAKYVSDLAGWHLDIAFNPAVLEAISVTEGDFLSEDEGNTFFQSGEINNAAGTITGISGAFIGIGGVTGSGTLFSVTFEAKAAGEGSLQMSEDRLGAANGNQIYYDIIIPPVIVESTYDLNGDGKVNLLDLALVAQNFGRANPQADANHDGTVDVFDLIAVAQHIGSIPQAPVGPYGTPVGIPYSHGCPRHPRNNSKLD